MLKFTTTLKPKIGRLDQEKTPKRNFVANYCLKVSSNKETETNSTGLSSRLEWYSMHDQVWPMMNDLLIRAPIFNFLFISKTTVPRVGPFNRKFVNFMLVIILITALKLLAKLR